MSFVADFIARVFGRKRDTDMVAIAQPQSEAEAQMMRERLERAGVPAMVQNRDTASAVYGSMGIAYIVWVMAGDANRAREELDLPGDQGGGDVGGGFDGGDGGGGSDAGGLDSGAAFDAGGGGFDAGGGGLDAGGGGFDAGGGGIGG